MTDIDNPFDGEACRIVRETGALEQTARDFVVIEHLLCGDTSALAFWLEADYQPGIEVRRFLALMLQPVRWDAEAPEKSFAVSPDLVPYGLEVRRRDGKRGPRSDPVVMERHRIVSEKYEKRLAEVGPGGSESVIREMADELGPQITDSMIREATKKRTKKNTKRG